MDHLLPHTLSDSNFCSHRSQSDYRTKTLVQWKSAWFFYREETYDALSAWLMEEMGYCEDDDINICYDEVESLPPEQQCSLWHNMLASVCGSYTHG